MTQEKALAVAVERWGCRAYVSLYRSIGNHYSERYSIGVFADDDITISHHGSGDSLEEALANVEECA